MSVICSLFSEVHHPGIYWSKLIVLLCFPFSEKPPITFSVTTKLRNRQYISDLADLTKPNTRALILELTNIFQPFFMKMFPDFLAINFLGFSSGSLVTNFDVTFEATSNVSSSNIIQALTTANNSRDLQFLIFEEITVMSVGNMNTPSETPTGLFWLFFAVELYSTLNKHLSLADTKSLALSFQLRLVQVNLKGVIDSSTNSWTQHRYKGSRFSWNRAKRQH